MIALYESAERGIAGQGLRAIEPTPRDHACLSCSAPINDREMRNLALLYGGVPGRFSVAFALVRKSPGDGTTSR